MGFTGVDSLITTASAMGPTMQRIYFSKKAPNSPSGGVPGTLWKATGVPGAGADGTLGKANGRTLSASTTGALVYQNPVTTTSHLVSFGAGCIDVAGSLTLLLVDRMADVQLSHAETTGAITGCDASTRMASTTAPGDGGQLWTEVTASFSAASNTITFGATDQLGNAGYNGTSGTQLTGMVTVASKGVGTSVNAQMWQTLTTNVTSIRALTYVTLTAGTATGQYNACIVRPIATITLLAQQQFIERDFVTEIPSIPKIFDNACLSLIQVASGSPATPTILGELRTCYN